MASQDGPTETSPLLKHVGEAAQNLTSGEQVEDSHLNGHTSNGTDEEAGSTTPNGTPKPYAGLPEVRKQLKYILPALSIGIFLSACDQTIIVSSYGKIGSELKALNNTSWIATAYFLTLTSFQPLYGKLSDIFGRKAALLFGYAIFGTGCLFCGLARDINELIAARAFAGIGGGGMTTVVSIMMSDIIPLRERGTWQGIINIIFASGAGIGAPLGGVLADYIGWRWAFLGQVPLCAVAFLSVLFTLKLPKQESADWKTKLKRVDFPGAFVLVCAVFTLLLGLDRGSNDSWSAPITIANLAITGPLFALFIFVEQKFASEPFAPGRIIFERSLFASYLCNFFSFGGWLGALFYVPLFYQAVDGYTATQAGVRLLPGIVAGVTGSLAGGYIMQLTGRYYWLTVGGYTLLTLAAIPLLLFTGLVANSTWGISIGLAMGGLGNGSGVTSSLIALISNAAPEDQAVATACSYLFRSLGSVVGLSVLSTVVQQSLQNQLAYRLRNGADAEEIARRVRESLDYVKELAPEIQEIVRESYASATRTGFGLVLAIVACSMISSFFIREKRLTR
jgi:predicted MFS family arabinose efflux permease